MTGRRKGTGRAVRRVESLRRAIAMHTARVAAAAGPIERVARALDLVRAVLRRAVVIDPAAADRAATRIVREVGRTVRDLEREIR